MISIAVLIALLVTHWIADFVCQTDWMATNKSKDNWPLFVHCLTYTTVFLPFAIWALPAGGVVAWFLLFTFITHFYIDYYTSKQTKKLSAQGKYGSNRIPNLGMFAIIGLDQLLHYICLIATYYFFITY